MEKKEGGKILYRPEVLLVKPSYRRAPKEKGRWIQRQAHIDRRTTTLGENRYFGQKEPSGTFSISGKKSSETGVILALS